MTFAFSSFFLPLFMGADAERSEAGGGSLRSAADFPHLALRAILPHEEGEEIVGEIHQ